jgi:hypothetical protein
MADNTHYSILPVLLASAASGVISHVVIAAIESCFDCVSGRHG